MNMSELTSTLTENEQQREERFRYVDLSHPLMQVLLNLQLTKTAGEDIAG